ncbi:MAG: molybdopterin-binding protein, partial [Planctomycetaceae bacterium]
MTRSPPQVESTNAPARHCQEDDYHETGVAAAVGTAEVTVIARPRVAVLSTGDEVVAPGADIAVGQVYDSNQRVLLDAVAELGCEPVAGGIVPDDEALL